MEPAFYTAIRPKVGPHATGAGDTEVTLTHLFFNERATLPALAIAGEVKFPTAKDKLIGTGKTDYTGYLIASKRVGKGGELTGMLGARYYVQPNFFLSLGVTYDNNNAILIRPGLTVKF